MNIPLRLPASLPPTTHRTLLVKNGSFVPPSAIGHLTRHSVSPAVRARYVLGEEIGAGATGFVLAATEIATGKPVTIKFILKERIPVTHWKRDRQMGTVPVEIFMLKRLQHPNIISFIEFFEDNTFFYLVTEQHGHMDLDLNDGASDSGTDLPLTPPQLSPISIPFNVASCRRPSADLFDHLQNAPTLTNAQIRQVFTQVVSAVAHLFSQNIVHRDIKQENILVDNDLNVKLIDFGSSAFIPSTKADYFCNLTGTLHTSAPEIINGERYQGPPQDIWSLGVLLYTLAFHRRPFISIQDTLTASYTLPLHHDRPEAMLDLIRRMLTVDVEQRININDILKHPWLAD